MLLQWQKHAKVSLDQRTCKTIINESGITSLPFGIVMLVVHRSLDLGNKCIFLKKILRERTKRYTENINYYHYHLFVDHPRGEVLNDHGWHFKKETGIYTRSQTPTNSRIV